MPTHVFERQGELCLCVPVSVSEATLVPLLERWERLQRGEEVEPAVLPPVDVPAPTSVLTQWRHFPLTLCAIAVSVVCYLVVATPWGWWWAGERLLPWLTFQSVVLKGDAAEVLTQWPALAEAWRYVTPVFLHFSFLHILFNSLMMLELGRRLEMVQGAARWVGVVTGSALLSNSIQFVFSPDTLFGGLSGVVYALIGYGWVYQRLRPRQLLVLPGLMVMALVWQAFAFAGVVGLAGLGNVANAAHVGGLLVGMVLGGVLARWDGRHLRQSGFQA